MKSNDLVEHDIIKCYHCGNETPMTKVGEYSWGSRDLESSEFDFFNRYELFACPVCHRVMQPLRKSYRILCVHAWILLEDLTPIRAKDCLAFEKKRVCMLLASFFVVYRPEVKFLTSGRFCC